MADRKSPPFPPEAGEGGTPSSTWVGRCKPRETREEPKTDTQNLVSGALGRREVVRLTSCQEGVQRAGSLQRKRQTQERPASALRIAQGKKDGPYKSKDKPKMGTACRAPTKANPRTGLQTGHYRSEEVWLIRAGRSWRRSAGPRLCGRSRTGRGLAEWLRWPFASGDRLREGS